MTRIPSLLAFVLMLTSAVFAQEFEIKKYDINASVNVETYTLEARARLSMVNLSGKDILDKLLLSNDKPKLSFYLNSKARVTAMNVAGNAVTPVVRESERYSVLVVSTDITSAFASAPEFNVEISYAIPLNEVRAEGSSTQTSTERNVGLRISPTECFALPGSFWVPVNHLPYAEHGADTAPLQITVNVPAGLKVVSSGSAKDGGAFENTYAAQPFFIAGDYEVFANKPADAGGLPSGPLVEVYAPRGLSEAGKQQAQRLVTEAARMLQFYSKYFGGAVGGTFRIVSSQARERDTGMTGELVSRGLNFAAPGMLIVSDGLFRRSALDLGTIEVMAGAAARAWIDGRVLLRGRGTGIWREALPVYLTAQYLGDRFGEAQREAAFERYRRAYAPVARGTDAPLLTQSVLDRGYATTMYNKGALVWRMIEKRLKRQIFDVLLRQLLDRQNTDVLTATDWRAPLCGMSRCNSLKNALGTLAARAAGNERQEIANLYSQWIENAILPDIAVGQPQITATGVESTVANFGSGDLFVDIVATTDKDEKLRQSLLVKAGEFPSVAFPAGTQFKAIEADPDKIYLQKDYANDSWPRRQANEDLYGQASLAFSKKEYAQAEKKIREALSIDSASATLQALLGRVLIAAGKNDEAARAFSTALRSEPLPLQAYGWAHLGLGELALQQNKAAEAVPHFREAAAAELDPFTTQSAYEGSYRAERAAGTIQISDEVKGFVQKFDAAILAGSTDSINQLVDLGSLRNFARRVVASRPSLWSSEILRTEQLDANRFAVDVRLKIRILDKESTGNALYVLTRTGGRIILSEVPVFDLK